MKTAAFLLLVLGSFASARAETEITHAVSLSSGLLSNLSAETEVRVVGVLAIPDATVLRVRISAAVLGLASKVRFVSLKDGQSQTLDAAQLGLWGQTSALFNGDAVRVELLVAGGDSGVSLSVQQVFSYAAAAQPGPTLQRSEDSAPETLCGTDDRVASGDNRVGRLSGGCTGWLVSNGAVLTAGHCPIGAGSIFEVNVPPSLPNGGIVASAVQDQFPVVGGSTTLDNNGLGDDWQVFTLGENNLKQFAHERHGFFRMTPGVPGAGSTFRVTGCGIDNTPVGSEPTVCGNRDSSGNCTHFGLNAQNQTLQTATGSFTALIGSLLIYSVDTEPANSGSPIIWAGTGFAVGIHTLGGCTSSGGSNSGTSFSFPGLENAIAAVPGPNTRYLDTLKEPGGSEDGTIFRPYDTLAEAVNAVPVAGRISIVRGNYFAVGITITKAMTLSAPVGPVNLGN